MTIRVSDTTGLLAGDLRRFAERRLRFALSRYDTRISQIELVVGDDRGDETHDSSTKTCLLTVRLQSEPDVVVSDCDADLAKCISRVAQRAARSVARRVSYPWRTSGQPKLPDRGSGQ